MDDAHGFTIQLEQCQMVVCKFIAAVQYMHVLRQLCRGFCTIVLHFVMLGSHPRLTFMECTRGTTLSMCLSAYINYQPHLHLQI